MNPLSRSLSSLSAVRRHAAALAFALLASVCIAAIANAQLGPIIELPPSVPTTMPVPPGGYPSTVAPMAVGPYFAPPSWSQTLAPNVRFVILSNFQNDAVLDRETGLVWTRGTVAEIGARLADNNCRHLRVGNRMGWRLPAAAELQTLIDSSVPFSLSRPGLPLGHPFMLTSADDYFSYWASEVITVSGFVYRRYVIMVDGLTGDVLVDNGNKLGVLCVRGAEGFSYVGPNL